MERRKNKKKGFTLVELLAVIVILAIILVIAVPKVMSVIEDSKKATLESSVKMIASAAEKLKVQNTLLGKTEEITCESVAKINNQDYQSCSIDFVDNTALVTVNGSGKFDGLVVCDGTKTEAEAQNGKCLISLIVDLNGGTDTVDYDLKYETGSEVTLTEPTREGYEFVKWKVSGTDASVNGNTLTIGTEKTIVTAIWKRSFATDDWATIIAEVNAAYENGKEYPYQVGDTKTVAMGSFGTRTLRVANTTKCSEVSVESKTACGFVLEFADILTRHVINGDSVNYTGATNVGGWPASELRTYVNSTIYNALPEELRNGIIETYVISSHGSDDEGTIGKNKNFACNDKLYLLSTEEVWAEGDSNKIPYDTSIGTSRQLDYYKDNNVSTDNFSAAIKKEYSMTAFFWWLRSARSYNDSYFYVVDKNGTWYETSSFDKHGISPAFRLAD